MAHATFRVGDLEVVIGDNEAWGQHDAGYNGLWSMQHASGTRSLFVPAFAGLNLEHIFDGEMDNRPDVFFEPRRAPMTFRPKEYGFTARAVFRPRCSREEILQEYQRWKDNQ
jgi:hypothetical protein